MGLDIILVRVNGKRENGEFDVDYVGTEFKWDDTRYVCRHRFLEELDFDYLSSGIYGDTDNFMRPRDFKKARDFANTADVPEYINGILDVLENNNDLWLELSR